LIEVAEGLSVGQALREAFRLQTTRVQRKSDGTILLSVVRFEIPARFRHFRHVVVRYARWDLGRVDLVDHGVEPFWLPSIRSTEPPMPTDVARPSNPAAGRTASLTMGPHPPAHQATAARTRVTAAFETDS
jgi:hypothetical protein